VFFRTGIAVTRAGGFQTGIAHAREARRGGAGTRHRALNGREFPRVDQYTH
jgi:hypothetical protein